MPGLILVYRDGVGGPQFVEKVMRAEINQVQEAIKQSAPNYDPKLVYCLVNKKVTTRFFEKTNGHFINPGPGTLVDNVIIEKDSQSLFDFFMVANQNPTSATALPVHYSVVFNYGGMKKNMFEELTH
jgi:hypothetical protein